VTPRASALQGMTPRQIAMLAGGVDAPQGVATGEADTDVCGPAGSMTTVRANAPDTYGIAQRRVALRKQAETCVHTANAPVVLHVLRSVHPPKTGCMHQHGRAALASTN
jgi:hypothetical protein